MSLSHYVCPITSCDWVYEVPEESLPDPDLIAPDFVAAFEAHSKAIEGACREHYATHGMEDWLREVMGLRAQLDQRQIMLCGLCISDARNAEARRQPALPILPATTVHSGIAVCDAEGRHRIVPQTGGTLLKPGENGFGLNPRMN